jgi:hypothetical protein
MFYPYVAYLTSLLITSGISHHPLASHQNSATLNRYIQPFKSFVAMIFRAARDNVNNPDHWVHTICVTNLAAVARGLSSPEHTTTLSDLTNVIHRICMCCWKTTWDIQDPLADPTYRFCVYYSFRKNGVHMAVSSVTGLFAQLKYIISLSMLCEICQSEDKIKACHELSPYFTDDASLSTFSMICNWQHIASTIVYNEAAKIDIVWKDREHWTELYYRGDTIELQATQNMFHQMESDLVGLWEKVLCGLSLRVDCDVIREDMSNTSHGYSFLSDPRNVQFSSAREEFPKAILTHPGLRDRFTIVTDGSRRWKICALAAWLVDYATLSHLLLLRCQMLTGGPARGTEMTSMIYRSSAEQPVRNMSIVDRYVVLLGTYSKTSTVSGKDHFRPRALDGVSGAILVQDLALARPFAILAVQLLYPDDSALLNIYNSYIFVNNRKLFTTDDITSKMKLYIAKYLQAELGVQAWRHLAIAWRRKLCPWASNVLENQHEDYIGAEQAGHSWAVERRLYGRSADALAGPTEDIVHLYLKASGNWQKAMLTVPGMSNLLYSTQW